MQLMTSGATVAAESKSEIWKFMKAMVRVLIAVLIGFAARPILDQVMHAYPVHAKLIDAIGQFTYALVAFWLFFLPSMRDYGVIVDAKKEP